MYLDSGRSIEEAATPDTHSKVRFICTLSLPFFLASLKMTDAIHTSIFDVDAEECWGEITNSLREVPLESGGGKKFIEAYLMGQMVRE